MTRGITPTSSSARALNAADPIVYVLPLPVWPYANTVALYPSKHASTKGATRLPYTAVCSEVGVKTSSK